MEQSAPCDRAHERAHERIHERIYEQATNSACVLSGQIADDYLERVSALVRAAHLNTYFPPAVQLLGHLSALHSRMHGGLYPHLAVEIRAGLPARKEWIRVQTDAELAESILPRLPPAVVLDNATTDEVFGEHLLKLLYCSRLPGLGLVPFESVQVELRKLDADSGIAQVRIIVDQVDNHGLLCRCTIELSENWQDAQGQLLLVRHGEEIWLSPGRRHTLLLLAATDAETIFTELAALPGVAVTRVCRGTIGPFCLAELPNSLPFGPLVHTPSGGFASFALEVAARDLVHDGSNDPLPHMLIDTLSAPTAAKHEQARVRLGYRVYRDRKFVSDLATQPALEALCRAAGTRNIIYTTALRSAAEVTQ